MIKYGFFCCCFLVFCATIFNMSLGMVGTQPEIGNSQDKVIKTPATEVAEKTYTNSIGMEFILIPAGSFLMGSKQDDTLASQDEKPLHEVSISAPFHFGKYEVTQKQWEDVMGSNPYTLKRTRSVWEPLLRVPGKFIKPEKPATVSWHDAQDFIKRLNEKEGHNRYRLPTEAEWEYAARAGTATAYSFGNNAGDLGRFAWYGENFESGSTHPVGKKEPNPWGLYDIHGNVWEWTQDWYDENYYANSPSTDPTGAKYGTHRVVRGGSWHQSADSWRSAFRRSYLPDYRGISIGFRLVLTINQ